MPATPPPRLKLSQLRLVAAIEDGGSVSAAAQALNLSQPAASRMVSELEAAFGAALCERLARGVRLTPLGVALARHARAVLQQVAEAERELGDLKAGRRGVVAIGAVTGPAFDLLPQAVGRVRAAAPDVELLVKIDSSNVLARDLLAGALDLALARVPDDLDAEAFESHAVGAEEAVLVVRRGHPLLGGPKASLDALSRCEWVMQPRGTPLRRAVETLFVEAGLAPPRRLLATTSLTMTILTVARTDAGAAVSREVARFAGEGTGAGALAVLPAAVRLTMPPYGLLSLRGRTLSPAARAVCDVLRVIAGRT
jgi:DNA-binding transcriptional LysR family regulator